MYAIIAVSGFQFRAASGDTLTIPKIPDAVGSSVTFGEVLLIKNRNETHIGTPLIPNASVSATVTAHGRADKIDVFKKKRRKGYRRRRGHRQPLTLVHVDKINLPSGAGAKAAKGKKRKKPEEAAA